MIALLVLLAALVLFVLGAIIREHTQQLMSGGFAAIVVWLMLAPLGVH